jgi:hypothetical protein
MSKGTKQIRFGKVEKVIDRLEFRIETIEEILKQQQLGDYSQGLQQGSIEQLQFAITLLKELGE